MKRFLRLGPTGCSWVAVVVALTLFGAGCAGARVAVTAASANYPISLSPVVRDDSGRLFGPRSLTTLGTFSASRTSVGLLYSALALHPTFDISDEINAQVSAAHGEAVVALTVSVGSHCNLLNAFPFLNALPVWPGCVPVNVSGTIVSRTLPSAPP